MIDHDARPGPLTRCQICGSGNLDLIIDLGHQPPCDSMLTAEQLNEPELSYPLRLMQCQACTLAQLDYVVPATEVYPRDYPYRAGISWPVVAAHKLMAEQLVQRFGKGFCVDVGSNDGTLLAQLKAQGCKVLGVEPTDIAQIAEADNDVPTLQRFFNEISAIDIVAGYGRAHLLTLTNVFAHMGDLGEVMRGIVALLAKDGVLVVENHYLVDVLERNQFDTIYHEHIRTYTLKSLICLFELYNLEVFDVERVGRYGGNIRVFVGWSGTRAQTPAVAELLQLEQDRWTIGSWARWRGRVLGNRDAFMTHLYSACAGEAVVGCSAPGRASTLLNFYGVTPETMRYTGELDGSLKLGKFMPGSHVPVVSNKRLIEDQPENIVLLAWHYADEIIQRLRAEGVKSELIRPLPIFTVDRA